MIFKKGELFCGPGGLAFGAKSAIINNKNENFTIEHAWANDIDYSACKTFAKNICGLDESIITTNEEEVEQGKTVVCKDVRELDIKKLPPIDAFTFGFPCNDFSIVGEQKGFNGEYGALYTYGIKVLKEHKPKWFLAENVGGLQSANEGSAFKKIIEDLSSVGYDEFGGYELVPHLYKFEEYGVPQARHRVIIVGIRKDLGVHYKVPAPTTKCKDTYKTSKWAFDIGCYNEGNVVNAKYNNEKTKHPESTIKRLESIPAGQNAWYEGIPEELRLKVKGAKLSNIYKRLDPNIPAYTVTGSGGGGTHMYHYDEPRALTNRERARLQTFPDGYIFQGKKEDIRRQIGMAVPPIGAKIIIEAILKSFAGLKYEYIEPKWDIDELRDIT